MADFQKEGFGNNPRDATSDRIGPKLSEKKGDTKSKASRRKESPIQSESFFDDTRSHREFQGREREKTGGRSKGKHKDPVESDFEKIVEKRDKAQKKFDKAKSATQKTTYSTTTVRKDQVIGQNEAGKNVYETIKSKVPNTELKSMVEFYKSNDRNQESSKDAVEEKPKASIKDKVEKNKEKVTESKKTKSAEKAQEKAPKTKTKSKTKGQEI